MEIIMHSPDDLAAAAEQFTAAMDGHKIFAFYGSMGAGKTTFIRAVCKALGVTEEVTSPSFAIVNEYLSDTTGEHFYHFDFYRIRELREAVDIGLDDYLYSGHLCIIEWPENVGPLLPEETLAVRISVNPDLSRTIEWED